MSHMGEDSARKSLKYMGYNITKGALPPCVSCREAKAKREHLPPVEDRIKCSQPNERI